MRTIIASCIALIALLGIGAVLAFTGQPADGVAPDGVRVDGVEVGGMDRTQILHAITDHAQTELDRTITITRDDTANHRMRLTGRQLGARANTGPPIEAALANRGAVGRVLQRLGMGGAREIPLTYALNAEAVDGLVAQLNAGFEAPPEPARLKVSKAGITLTPGSAGAGIDEAELRRSLSILPEQINLRVGTYGPPVTTEAAEVAKARAEAIISAPIAVAFQGNSVSIPPRVLRGALRFSPRPPDLAVQIDPAVIYRNISPAFARREKAARDAAFQVRGDTVRLIPAATGRSLDMDAMAAAIASLPEDRQVRARFEVTQPTVATDELSGLGIKEPVGEFTTYYPCCQPRVTNIKRAAELLDGTIIPAGHRLSLNDALGPRTAERGFVEAPGIAAGMLEDTIGGGVSQVATTFFNAAFFAGLEIETHAPHSFYIDRYPVGREATISMGGPELIVRNNWDAAVLVSAVATDGEIAIRMFSTSFDRRVETTTGERTDPVEPEEKEIYDSSLEPGTRTVEQYSGSAGFTISYTRTVWKGSEQIEDRTFHWTYQPQHAFIKVGPEAPEPTDTAPNDPTTPSDTSSSPTPAPSAPSTPEPSATPSADPEPAPSNGGAAPPLPLP